MTIIAIPPMLTFAKNGKGSVCCRVEADVRRGNV